MLSTPAAMASAMPGPPWACAAILSPWSARRLRGGEFGERVLRFVRAQRGGHVAARSHDLDRIDAPGRVRMHGLADALLAIGLAAEEPAVPAGDCDRRARRQDFGADLRPGTEPVPQRQRHVVAIAQITKRGDAAGQRPQRREAHPQQEGGVVVSGEASHRVGRCVECEVLVDIDQTGQQRDVTEVDEVGISVGARRCETSTIRPADTSMSGSSTIESARPSNKRFAVISTCPSLPVTAQSFHRPRLAGPARARKHGRR